MSAHAPARLSQAEVDKTLSELPGWTVEGGKLHRDYTFVDFVAAFGFMTGAALIAQPRVPGPNFSFCQGGPGSGGIDGLGGRARPRP